MKKYCIAMLLTVMVATSQAQINYGAKAGVNISSIGGKDIDGYSSRAGIYFGGQVEIPIVKSFSVQPELFYSMQGARWEDDGEKSAWSYLQLPVLAKYRHASGFFAEAGPQIGFLLAAHDTYDGNKEDVKEYLDKTDISLAFGAGYQVTPRIGVSVRYNTSVTSFYEKEKNRFAAIGLSYTFPK